METCGRCGRQVDQIHPIPSEVLTRELVTVMGGAESAAHLEACGKCIDELMRGG